MLFDFIELHFSLEFVDEVVGSLVGRFIGLSNILNIELISL
jgi:hypothetical protein